MKQSNSKYGVLFLLPALLLSSETTSIFTGGVFMYVLTLSLYPLSFLFIKDIPAGEKAAISMLIAGFILSVTLDYFTSSFLGPHLYMTTVSVLGAYMIDTLNFTRSVKFLDLIKTVTYIICLAFLIFLFRKFVFTLKSGLFFSAATLVVLMRYKRK
ncbi:MAG: hypothetical protein GX817_05055 [Elusimicrobia bacterium]|nr:hypothetical protein [Elusimicrobiota bacterium]